MVTFIFWICWLTFSRFSDSKIPKEFFKGACIRKPSPSPSLHKIKLIEEMPHFMHKYIKCIVNVESDNNYSFQAVSSYLVKERKTTNFSSIFLYKIRRCIRNHTQNYTGTKQITIWFSMLLCLVLVVRHRLTSVCAFRKWDIL